MHTSVCYEVRVEGHIGDSWSSWFEGLALRREDNGETVLRGTIVDQAALHGVLIRIRDLGLPLVSVHRVEGHGSGGRHTSELPDSRREIAEARDQVVEFIDKVKFAYPATLGTDSVPRARPLAAHTVYGDAVYSFTFRTIRKVAELAAHPQAELVWCRLQDRAQARMRDRVALAQDAEVQARFKADNPMVAQLLPPGAEHLFALFILNVHKLVSVAVVVLLGIAVYRTNQAAAPGATEGLAVVLTGLFFLGTMATGDLVAIGKPVPAIVSRLHQIRPYLTVLSTAATLYLLPRS